MQAYTIGHMESVEMQTSKTNRSRETVNEIYRLVLEELQRESHTAAYRKVIATDQYRDLVGQHHLEP
jgi:hypothetical protein